MTPEQLKASILQYAIQGKLVEQRSEEGTGEDLYRQIRTDCQQEEAQPKRRSKKTTPVIIAEQDLPFDIPETWKWVKLGELGHTNIGLTYSPKDVCKDGIVVLRSSNIQNGKMDYEDIVKVSCPIPDNKMCHIGDILICARNGSKRLVGKAALIDREGMSFGAFMAIFRSVCNPYILHVINSTYFRNTLLGDTGTTTINQITQDMLKNVLIPLPPLAEQKRIVAKIEELLPYVDRYAAAYEKLDQFNAKFPEDMKKSILQYAIQGKLVEQRPEEGTGEELYRQIQAEKQRLIKEGKIKKEKPLAEIAEDELPFDIPESWKWYRIGELFNIVNGFTPLKSNPEFWTDGDIPWFTIEDVRRQGRFISSTEKFITRKALAKNTERIVPADTVLLCCTASVGEYAYAKIPLTTNQQFNAFVVKDYYKNAVYPLYVFEYAKTLKGSLIDRAGKTTFNFVSVGKLSNMLIPLPPLAEQKRIVSKLEEILPLCEWLK